MMERSDAAAIAAAVACPARSEWPAYLAAPNPARSASFCTTLATSTPANRPAWTCSCRLIDRNSGPLLIPAWSVHACRFRTGHCCLVRFRNRVQPPLNASRLQPCGAFPNVERHSFRGRRQRVNSAGIAPTVKLPSVALISPDGIFRLRFPDKLTHRIERGGRNYVRPRALYRPDNRRRVGHAARSGSASRRLAESLSAGGEHGLDAVTGPPELGIALESPHPASSPPQMKRRARAHPRRV